MKEKIAFLFPGQGSQEVGMGRDLYDNYSSSKEIFQQVDEICNRPISRICFEGPMDKLTVTDTLQPAITAVSVSCLTALRESGVEADISAGHSVGEYPALVSAGVISARDSLRLAQKRGELMNREAVNNPGGMAAIIGMDMKAVMEIVAEARARGIIDVANHNTAQQIVITGEKEALGYAVELVKARKARAIPLKVSGAWHSRLMKAAYKDFVDFLKDIPFSRPKSPMFFNATAQAESDPETIKGIMAKQLLSPVRWYEIIVNMLEAGVVTFIEVGPKKVLSGLVGKIVPDDKNVKIYNVSGLEGLENFLAEFKKS